MYYAALNIMSNTILGRFKYFIHVIFGLYFILHNDGIMNKLSHKKLDIPTKYDKICRTMPSENL